MASAPGVGPAGSGPLYLRIADDLRGQIRAGALGPGQRLPSEHALMARFGVARGTVRQALAALRLDGTVSGSRGRPLAVREAPLAQPLSQLISFSTWIEALGKHPSGRVVSSGLEPATAEAAEALGLGLGDPVFRLVRLRLADEHPLMIERAVFPGRLAAGFARFDLARESIYAALARQGIVFASARHAVGAMAAARSDARLLGVASRTPLLRIRRHAFSPTGEALEWSEDRYLASEVEFTIENAASGQGVSRRLS
jgi:GntR family transcriptional regulator